MTFLKFKACNAIISDCISLINQKLVTKYENECKMFP